jgi:hypothetical protein
MTGLDEHGRLLPESFDFLGATRKVAEILDRWREGGSAGRPEISYFKVRTPDGKVFILRYVTLFDAWAVLDVPEAG